MIQDINTIIAMLNNVPAFSGKVEHARAKQIVLSAESTLPRIYVGYSEIHSLASISAIAGKSILDAFNDTRVQVIETSLVTTVETFHTYWPILANRMTLFDPSYAPLEGNLSGWVHFNGGVQGIEQKKQWHLDHWIYNLESLT